MRKPFFDGFFTASIAVGSVAILGIRAFQFACLPELTEAQAAIKLLPLYGVAVPLVAVGLLWFYTQGKNP